MSPVDSDRPDDGAGSENQEEREGPERRPSARLRTQLWIQLDGIDPMPKLRAGNVSRTGLYVDLDVPVGIPGTVHTMMLESMGRQARITLPARIVRVVSYRDIWRGEILVGAAFEFVAGDDTQRRTLMDFILSVLKEQFERDGEVAVSQRIHIARSRAKAGNRVDAAVLTGADLEALSIETDWPITPGQTVTIELSPGPDGTTQRLQGIAKQATIIHPNHGKQHAQGAQRYHLEVQLESSRGDQPVGGGNGDGDGDAMGSSIHEVINNLIDGAMVDIDSRRDPDGEQFTGQLSRVKLSTLLTLIDMERLTGTLQLRHDSGPEGRLFVRDGELVDAELGAEPDAKVDAKPVPTTTRVLSLLTWNDGTFEFVSENVDRPNVINMSVTQLLLEAARQRDEDARA